MGTEEISDFEKQRLANIAERDALLKKLSLDAQSAGLFPPKMPRGVSGDQTKPKKKAAPKKVKKEEVEAPLPRRTSSRLRGIKADSEIAKRKADEEYELAQQAERAKRVRKSDAFSFNDIFVSGQKLSADALIGVDVVTKGFAVPNQRTFGEEDIKSTKDSDLKALRKEMSGLQLWEAWEPNRIKLTPERVYSMTFHPSEAKPLIFAGDKMGHLGILDASQEKPISAIKSEDEDENDGDGDDDPDPVLVTLKPHTRTISSMTIHPSTPTKLYTTSYDSSIRETDLEKTTSVEKYAPASTSEDIPISGIDMAAEDPHTLYWTTLDGEFGRYDMRTKRQESVSTWQLSEKKIGGFSLYQTHPHYFATASLDRTMRLWDLRKLSRSNPVPIGAHQSRLSVSHAAFNAAGQIATSSYDDTLKIYDFSTKGIAAWTPGHNLDETQMTPETVVRHNCQTGRW
ncbi:hypothetical protein ARAM_004159, partial [Aspergillus rambellii]